MNELELSAIMTFKWFLKKKGNVYVSLPLPLSSKTQLQDALRLHALSTSQQ